jgi:hypothetical protein
LFNDVNGAFTGLSGSSITVVRGNTPPLTAATTFPPSTLTDTA